jgi:hypothetical protein
MRSNDVRLQLAVAVLCICMPVYESLVFFNQSVLLAWAAELHLLSALALSLAALFLWSPQSSLSALHLWFVRVGLVGCAILDVLVQYVQGSDYRMLSLMQPFHVLTVAFLAWILGSMATTQLHPLLPTVVALYGPLTVVWGVCATWSPLVAVYADSTSGGDRAIGQATTAMLVFAASMTLALRQTTQRSAPRGVVVVGLTMFALTQGLISANMRFVPLLFLCAILFEGLRILQPTAPRLTVFATVVLCVAGYFATLHLTTRIAWDMTAWLGVCVLSACVATALCTVQYRPSGGTV